MSAIFKRELKSYFHTPLGYVFLGVYLAFSGGFFYLFTLTTSTSVVSDVGTADFGGMFSLMFFVLMLTVPLLTMRLFAEEKKNKTDQLLLTAPVSLFGLVTAKFAAAFAVLLISTAAMPLYGVVLSAFTEVSWRTLLGNALGLVLLGAVYVAVGTFVSALTESQMLAAIVSVFINIGFLMSSIAAQYVPAGFAADALRQISLLERYDRFTVGILEPENAVFFVSIAVVFLFLTVQMLERRRWA